LGLEHITRRAGFKPGWGIFQAVFWPSRAAHQDLAMFINHSSLAISHHLPCHNVFSLFYLLTGPFLWRGGGFLWKVFYSQVIQGADYRPGSGLGRFFRVLPDERFNVISQGPGRLQKLVHFHVQ
jgi:hypothetical protein